MILYYAKDMLIFGIMCLISGIFVILSKNPIHSVLFLILVFLNSAGLLLLLKVEFLAMLFLVVYVGAIAILFLFVVMMLNIKSLDENISRYVPISSLIGILFLIEILMMTRVDLISFSPSVELWQDKINSLSNIEAIGELMYTHYFILYIICSFILLVAMIGAILLTMHKRGDYLVKIEL